MSFSMTLSNLKGAAWGVSCHNNLFELAPT